MPMRSETELLRDCIKLLEEKFSRIVTASDERHVINIALSGCNVAKQLLAQAKDRANSKEVG